MNTVPPIRRILLRTTRNHIYYQVHDDRIVLLSVWGAVRGSGPPVDG